MLTPYLTETVDNHPQLVEECKEFHACARVYTRKLEENNFFFSDEQKKRVFE